MSETFYYYIQRGFKQKNILKVSSNHQGSPKGRVWGFTTKPNSLSNKTLPWLNNNIDKGENISFVNISYCSLIY